MPLGSVTRVSYSLMLDIYLFWLQLIKLYGEFFGMLSFLDSELFPISEYNMENNLESKIIISE